MSTAITRGRGITLRQAALIAGFAYILNPITYAEFALYPKIVMPGDMAQTVANMATHGTMFATAIVCYLINYIADVVISWALYELLVPVNRALSLLTALFRLTYTALGLVGVLQLAIAFRLVHGGSYASGFTPHDLQVQVATLLASFRYGWQFSLIVFGVHLSLLGYLIYRSRYIPKLLGALLVLDGLGWIANGLHPYLYPTANIGWFFAISFVELLLPLWLLIRGWKIQESFAESMSDSGTA